MLFAVTRSMIFSGAGVLDHIAVIERIPVREET